MRIECMLQVCPMRPPFNLDITVDSSWHLASQWPIQAQCKEECQYDNCQQPNNHHSVFPPLVETDERQFRKLLIITLPKGLLLSAVDHLFFIHFSSSQVLIRDNCRPPPLPSSLSFQEWHSNMYLSIGWHNHSPWSIDSFCLGKALLWPHQCAHGARSHEEHCHHGTGRVLPIPAVIWSYFSMNPNLGFAWVQEGRTRDLHDLWPDHITHEKCVI